MNNHRFISQLYRVISQQKNVDYVNLFESKVNFIENHVYIHKKLEELEVRIERIEKRSSYEDKKQKQEGVY